MDYYIPMIADSYNFIGRRPEQQILERIASSDQANIIIIHGRRRVGKTTLIEHIFNKRHLLKLEGVEGGNKTTQIQTVLITLASHFKDPAIAKLQFDRWYELFEYVSRYVIKGEHTLYLEELQWLASYDDELIRDLKLAWDNLFSKNSKLILILCGSSPSFMINHVVNSKALYGRAHHQIHVTPFSIPECAEYMGRSCSLNSVMDAYLSVGGIPEYLKHLKSSSSPYLSLCRESFLPHSYFFGEYERVFISSMATNKNYRTVIELLATHKFLTRQDIAKKLKIESGGTLSSLLHELELSQFVNSYTPYDKKAGSKLERFEISDQYLQFYYRFIAPIKKRIEQNTFQEDPTRALKANDYQQWLGYAFERWCRQNHALIARKLGFSAVQYDVGPYFSRSTPLGFQIDLIFSRADRVTTVCEIKYTHTPVSKSVIQKFEHQLDLLPLKPRQSMQRVLISASGADESVQNAGFFDQILTLEDLCSHD